MSSIVNPVTVPATTFAAMANPTDKNSQPGTTTGVSTAHGRGVGTAGARVAIVDGPTVNPYSRPRSSMPGVSVIIPTYNCGRWLQESLDGIFAQTEPPVEVVVVEDGSTDDTPEVLARYAGRITVVQGAHGGLSAARNLGLARATGEWVAFHDADDVAVPDRLAWSLQFLREHPQHDAVFCNGRRMGADGTNVVPARYFAAAAGRAISVIDLF